MTARTWREAAVNVKKYFEAIRDGTSVVTDEGVAERTQLNEILKYMQYIIDGVPLQKGEQETLTEMARD